MPSTTSNLIVDGLGQFSKGMDSGKDAFLLDADQCSFATNVTFRGDYANDRPPVLIQKLVIDPSLAAPATQSLFQGACYYAPDSGQQMLVAQIGGRLFTFTPSALDATTSVTEITIPGDPNPPSLPQAWLRQAERWVIVNNGVNNPIFFDGVFSRRSVPVSGQIGIVAANFDTPPIGGQVSVTTSAPLDKEWLNQSIQIVEHDVSWNPTTTTTYWVVSIGAALASTITIKNLGDVPGATQGTNTNILSQPSCIGNIIGATATEDFNGTVYTNIKLYCAMSSVIPYTAAVGTVCTINGDSNWVIALFDATRTVVEFVHLPMIAPLTIPASGTDVFISANTTPNVTVAVLDAPMTAPAVGASQTIAIKSPYTGPNGAIVYLNGRQYSVVTSGTSAASATNIVLQNINDPRYNATTGNIIPATTTTLFNFPELPPGRMLAYGMGRVWESLTDGITFMAGDIVRGPSGSPAYNYRDSILKVTENSFLAGGGSFSVPSNLGQITGMVFTSQLDASLGQGPLMVVTPGGIFSCNAPVDRTTWSSMQNPILSESLIGLGGLAQDSCVVVNGDLLFRSLDGIRSLIMARRDFWSWGNTPISFEMTRVLDLDQPNGLPYGSGVQFDNRLLMTASPTQGPLGVFNQSLVALNFDPISSLQGKANSIWDGMWTGINVLKLIVGQFNGLQRCFAFTYNSIAGKIELYEILKSGSYDNGSQPIQWSFETPFLFKGAQGKGLFDQVAIEDGEFYVEEIHPGDKLHFRVDFRPDFASCWFPWHEFDVCNDGASTTDTYGVRLGLGKPDSKLFNEANQTAANYGRWFQFRFTINGHCVWKGMKVSASIQDQPQFARVIPSGLDTNPPCQ